MATKVLRLGREEQETHFNRMGDSKVWSVYTDDTRMINELRSKGYTLIEEGHGFRVKSVKLTVRTNKKRKVSEETKEKRRLTMKKNWEQGRMG